MRINYYNYKIILIIFSVIIIANSCKKFIEVDNPKAKVLRSLVFEKDETAIAAVVGIYKRLSSLSSYSISNLTALSADEIVVTGDGEIAQFYQNSIVPSNLYVLDKWNDSYNVIYLANAVIEGLGNSTSITDSLKNQLLGEAYFIRAYSHFYLTVIFGDVPYIRETDFEKNNLVSRTPVATVYDSIIADLKNAQHKLSSGYYYSKGERTRVNKWAATALLSRLYLYTKDWTNAETESGAVINSPLFSLKNDVDQVFLKNSTEAIFQLATPPNEQYTFDGSFYNRPTYSLGDPEVDPALLAAFSLADQRRIKWIDTTTANGTHFFPSKYKQTYFNASGTEYSMVLRLAEQYLIRAEARAMQNKLTGTNSAESDINIIRSRAGIENTNASELSDLLDAVENERRMELFTEGGDRWCTLKRLGHADEILSAAKPYWNTTDNLFPIPYAELLLNPNLKPNPGY